MKNLLFILTFTLALTCCREPHYATFTGFEQGTTYSIVAKITSENLNTPQAQSPKTDNLQTEIDSLFRMIDLTFSMFNPASLVSRINRNETDAVTPLFEECFTLAKQIHTQTEGYYDPTVKPLVDAWGFGPGDRQKAPCVECLLEYVGFDKIRIENSPAPVSTPHIIKSDPRIELDFSSIAKGFTVDKLAELIESKGISDYLVEVGGEIRALGVNETGRPWRIGIDKPNPELVREIEAVVTFAPPPRNSNSNSNVRNGGNLRAVATSGNYRNLFVDEQGRTRVHTIDPKTGTPVSAEILSASIAASTCAAADAWATGIMASATLENARRLLKNAEIEYYIIYSTESGETRPLHSPGFPVEKIVE